MGGDGSVVVSQSGTLTMQTGGITLDGGTLSNYGTATLSGASYFYLENAATFNNEAGATLC